MILRSSAGALTGALAALTALCAASSITTSADAMTLAKDGITSYKIVVAKDAIPAEKTAAAELSSHLQEVCGAEFQTVSEDQVSAGDRKIVVGPSRLANSLAQDVDWSALGTDGTVIVTVGDDLVIAGGRPRGTLYAVYTFLEDVIGIRWWTSSEKHVPSKPELKIGRLSTVYRPQFWMRQVNYFDTMASRQKTDAERQAGLVFAARLKLNGAFQSISEEYGLDLSGDTGHSFYRYISPMKYAKSHPEWFSLVDGQRKFERAQLCLTNLEMRREFIKNVIADLRANPDWVTVPVTINDAYGNCECAGCRAVEEREESRSGPVIEFVNAVAEAVEEQFPGVMVGTLAYYHTVKPPLHLRTRDNVYVVYCFNRADVFYPQDSPQNREYADQIAAWTGHTKHLVPFDYFDIMGELLLPAPNLHVMGPDIRFFRRLGAAGVWSLGNMYNPTGDFTQMRCWVYSHLAWDPSLDENKLMGEFLRGYYGAAAPHLQSYLDIIHKAHADQNVVRWRSSVTIDYATLDVLNASTRAFNRAEKSVASDPVLLARVRRERLPLDLLWIERYWEARRESEMTGKVFLGPADIHKAVEDYIVAVKAAGVITAGETRPLQWLINQIRQIADLGPLSKRQPATPAECAGLASEKWKAFYCSDFGMIDHGVSCDVVNDPASSTGRVCRLNGTAYRWIQMLYSQPEDLGSWRVFVSARAESNTADGPAIAMGVWDHEYYKPIVTKIIDTPNTSPTKYVTYDLGIHDFGKRISIWVSVPEGGKAVSAVYVDRVVLVRQ